MSESKRTDEIQGEIIHVYDGIEEADNSLPGWWLYGFYLTIAFAVLYWFYFEVFHVGPSSMEAYLAELEAMATVDVTDEMLDSLVADGEVVAAGQAIYARNCVPCHGERGEGVLGPNLTDNHWVHGGAPTAIYQTIDQGVVTATAAMPPWGPQLGPTGMQQVVAYVLSIRGTNVEGGKEPEGEEWLPPTPASPASDADGGGDAADAAAQSDAGATSAADEAREQPPSGEGAAGPPEAEPDETAGADAPQGTSPPVEPEAAGVDEGGGANQDQP